MPVGQHETSTSRPPRFGTRRRGSLLVRGYPLKMVLAEKVATAVARGTANTRWRDFVDLYTLEMRHEVDSATFRSWLDRVAQYRKLTLVPLVSVLVGYLRNRASAVGCVAEKAKWIQSGATALAMRVLAANRIPIDCCAIVLVVPVFPRIIGSAPIANVLLGIARIIGL